MSQTGRQQGPVCSGTDPKRADRRQVRVIPTEPCAFRDVRVSLPLTIDDGGGRLNEIGGGGGPVEAVMPYRVPMQVESRPVVHSDPEISGGTPVFRGTRVPVRSLFGYLEGGETIKQFLDQFPSVSKEQALSALDLARDSILARARSA